MVRDEGEYGARLRIKVSTTGLNAGILWSHNKERIGTVKDFDTRGSNIDQVIAFTKVWWMGGMHGVTLELSHAMVAQRNDDAQFDWPEIQQEDPW